MKKGIVLELNDSYLTVLTPDGEFLQAHRQDIPYTIGEEIHFFPVAEVKRRNWLVIFSNFPKTKPVLALTAALLISIGSLIPVYQNNRAYAYMTIGADSSIELGLNKKMQVVKVIGHTEHAEEIISQLGEWEKKKVSELTPVILTKLEDEGLINSEKPLILSTIKTKKLDESVTSKLEENINGIEDKIDNVQVQVNSYTTTSDELEKALDLGVPIGQYYKEKNTSKGQNKEEKKQEKSAKQQEKQQNEQSSSIPSLPEDTSPAGNVNQQLNQNSSQNDLPTVNGQDQSNQQAPGQQKRQEEPQIETVKPNNGQMKKQSQENNKPNKQEKSNKK